MLVAVLSDCHDNIWNLEKVLPRLKQAEVAIFCGDFCAPFTLKMLAEGFDGPVHAVLGNNDGDVYLLLAIASQAGNVTLYPSLCQLELEGKRIAAVHYPDLGEALACPAHLAALRRESVGPLDVSSAVSPDVFESTCAKGEDSILIVEIT